MAFPPRDKHQQRALPRDIDDAPLRRDHGNIPVAAATRLQGTPTSQRQPSPYGVALALLRAVLDRGLTPVGGYSGQTTTAALGWPSSPRRNHPPHRTSRI